MAEHASLVGGLATLIAHLMEMPHDQLTEGPCDGAGALMIPLIRPLTLAIVFWVSPSVRVPIVHLNATFSIHPFLPLSAVAGGIGGAQTTVNQMAAALTYG
jgi:hypothetical protein